MCVSVSVSVCARAPSHSISDVVEHMFFEYGRECLRSGMSWAGLGLARQQKHVGGHQNQAQHGATLGWSVVGGVSNTGRFSKQNPENILQGE